MTTALVVDKSITEDRVIDIVQSGESLGLCLSCGEEREMCEPDAQYYACECCGEKAVFGAEEILIRHAFAGTRVGPEDE